MKKKHAFRFALIFAAAFTMTRAAMAGPQMAPGAAASLSFGQSADFHDCGVAAPVSNWRGMVATIDSNGRDVVLLWLKDYRGGYALLMIDAQTGHAEQFPMPFDPAGDCPYASILSRENKFYTAFNGYFVEFDPAKRAFTFFHKVTSGMAMSMTEDDAGVIWAVNYPQDDLVSFNPRTRALHDFGEVYKQSWPQYPRHIAADDAGDIYFAIGSAANQIIIFDPQSAQATPVFAESDRKKEAAYLYRDLDGKVYGEPVEGDNEWYELYKGVARKIDRHDSVRPKPEIAGPQALKYTHFPDGAELLSCDLINRRMKIMDAGATSPREVSFDYTSEGASVMGAIASPDGTITGGTAFPMCCFIYDPKTDHMTSRVAYGQWNATTRLGTHLFVGGYPGGFLLDWDTTKPWSDTSVKNPDSNPAIVTATCDPDIHRPSRVLAMPDGKTVIMAGTPQYGYTGGGLLFWDRASGKCTVLSDADVIPDQSTRSLVLLSDNEILGGTTTEPGTGGMKKAHEAELYLMNLTTQKVAWHTPVIPGVQDYTDLFLAPDGLVYGLGDQKIFFVFDPAKRTIVYQHNASEDLGLTASQQGPRIFISAGPGQTYILFQKGIVRINPKSYELTLIAPSPVSIDAGGDYLDGKIYFVVGSHLWSYRTK